MHYKRFWQVRLCRTSMVWLLGLCSAASGEMLIHNVNGYTLDNGELQRFGALSIDKGKVVALFDAGDPLPQITNQLDGGGATMLPGLIDAHGHVASLGHALRNVDLTGSLSEERAAQRVAKFISLVTDSKEDPGQSKKENPKAKEKVSWILGRGWNQVLWPSKTFPGTQSLDAISGDFAVALNRIDGHALWVNSKALHLAGINKDTADPEGGQIIRDQQGSPTGVLIDNAMDLVRYVMPPTTANSQREAVRVSLKHLASVGLTSVHDAGSSASEIRALQELRTSNELPIRVYSMLDALDDANQNAIAAGIRLDPTQMLDVRSIKLSADGALGSRGAALKSPYSDEASNSGLLLLSKEELQSRMATAMAAGYQVNVHAIGDLANTQVLDLYEQLQALPLRSLQRHRVEHAQILSVSDIDRFNALDVIASVQPTHATSDMNMASDRLGHSRLKGAYAWNSLLESGALLAGGSDFPVELPNPLHGLYAAVSRQSQTGEPKDGWRKSEIISRQQALALFTENAAFAAHQEKSLGRLLPGYWADFILLGDDYFTVPTKSIWSIPILQTWVAGKPVFVSTEHD
ncbi:MAG: amidohydrolase [Pseudomonadales bacterium]